MKNVINFYAIALFLASYLLSSISLAYDCDVDICFTTGQQCDQRIISAIESAQHTIYVQAYQFSRPIQNALVSAKQRLVKVEVILDKSQEGGKYQAAMFFHNMGIPVWIDNKVAIAHNKVMIIDGKTVITGSYNYSRAAQSRNAENVVFINSKEIANQYLLNFNNRLSKSFKY